MQTFLPYPDFAQSAKCLDMRRLGKQRVEVLQLLKALISGPVHWVPLGDGNIQRVTAWYNHPAAKMWRGYELSLVDYGLAICQEWIDRGYKDTCYAKICETAEISEDDFPTDYSDPPWLGNEEFHAAHRSNLLRKDPIHYGQFGWTEPDDLPYVWPVA